MGGEWTGRTRRLFVASLLLHLCLTLHRRAPRGGRCLSNRLLRVLCGARLGIHPFRLFPSSSPVGLCQLHVHVEVDFCSSVTDASANPWNPPPWEVELTSLNCSQIFPTASRTCNCVSVKPLISISEDRSRLAELAKPRLATDGIRLARSRCRHDWRSVYDMSISIVGDPTAENVLIRRRSL